MLNTTQCHQPLPVGASGSYMVTAKLLVPVGAPLQLSAGETLPPVQPKPLNTCSLAMVAPSLISALVRVRLCACAALTPSKATPIAATQRVDFMTDLPVHCRCDALAASKPLERAKGIEPSYAAWEAAVLPLNYARDRTS